VLVVLVLVQMILGVGHVCLRVIDSSHLDCERDMVLIKVVLLVHERGGGGNGRIGSS
jgi:hypothetical protein